MSNSSTSQYLNITQFFSHDNLSYLFVKLLNQERSLSIRQLIAVASIPWILLTEDLTNGIKFVENSALICVFLYLDLVHEMNEFENVTGQSINWVYFESINEDLKTDEHRKLWLMMNVKHKIEVVFLLTSRQRLPPLHHQIPKIGFDHIGFLPLFLPFLFPTVVIIPYFLNGLLSSDSAKCR